MLKETEKGRRKAKAKWIEKKKGNDQRKTMGHPLTTRVPDGAGGVSQVMLDWLDLDLLALNLSFVQVLHGFLSIPNIVKLDEFVVLFVGSLPYLFDFTILPKRVL